MTFGGTGAGTPAGTDPDDIDLDDFTSRAGGHAVAMERTGYAYRFTCQCGTPLGTVTDLRRVPIVVLRWEMHLTFDAPAGTGVAQPVVVEQDVAHVPERVPARGHVVPVQGRARDMTHRGTHAPASIPVGRRIDDLRPL